jgi:NADH-quinone oxidoreductase subunit J
MVLFLFTIMFINMNQDAEQKSNLMKVAATIAAGCLLLVSAGAMSDTSGADFPQQVSQAEIGTVSNLGKALYGDFVLPFEITSILLLTAMVGAVMLGKKKGD